MGDRFGGPSPVRSVMTWTQTHQTGRGQLNDFDDLVDRYIATFNETDPTIRREMIDRLWTDDGGYVDPVAVAEGRDAVNSVIATVQAQFPGLVFRLAGPVDAHHNVARFSWHLGPAGGEAIVIGSDVVVQADDGRIRRLYGFLDKIPAA
jgi:hypothetical protein